MPNLVQKMFVEKPGSESSILPGRIVLLNPDGTPFLHAAQPVKDLDAASADAAAIATAFNGLLANLRAAGVLLDDTEEAAG